MQIAALLAFGALVGGVVFVTLGLSILRFRSSRAADPSSLTLKARLKAIERDLESGLIGEAEAAEAAIEAKRAALEEPPQPLDRISRPARFAALAFLALAPLVAFGIYMKVGAPNLVAPTPRSPGTSELDSGAIAAMPEDQRRAMIESMVSSLAARLEVTPDDADGWRMLARSQLVLSRSKESAASYRRLFALEAGTLEDWRNFATTLLTGAPSGRFPTDDEFASALDEMEKRSPGDPMVLFYRGGVARENGDPAGAAELWSQLLKTMPADAPVRETLEQMIEEARTEASKP
jgi:cytochrome c-type biogenesis protein CcmH